MPDDPEPTPPPSEAEAEQEAAASRAFYQEALAPRDPYQDVVAAIGGTRELIGLLKEIVVRLEDRIDRIESALTDDDMD